MAMCFPISRYRLPIDGSEAVATVTQYNMPQKGQLTITKTGEVFASVQENDGLYQPVYEVAGLPGAVYGDRR